MYCVKCKRQTPSEGVHCAVSKNGRPMQKGICSVCGTKQSQFMKGDVSGGALRPYQAKGGCCMDGNGLRPFQGGQLELDDVVRVYKTAKKIAKKVGKKYPKVASVAKYAIPAVGLGALFANDYRNYGETYDVVNRKGRYSANLPGRLDIANLERNNAADRRMAGYGLKEDVEEFAKKAKKVAKKVAPAVAGFATGLGASILAKNYADGGTAYNAVHSPAARRQALNALTLGMAGRPQYMEGPAIDTRMFKPAKVPSYTVKGGKVKKMKGGVAPAVLAGLAGSVGGVAQGVGAVTSSAIGAEESRFKTRQTSRWSKAMSDEGARAMGFANRNDFAISDCQAKGYDTIDPGQYIDAGNWRFQVLCSGKQSGGKVKKTKKKV